MLRFLPLLALFLIGCNQATNPIIEPAQQPEPVPPVSELTLPIEADAILPTPEFEIKTQPVYNIDTLDFRTTYKALKSNITRKRLSLAAAYKKAGTDSAKEEVLAQAGRYLHAALTEEIFPAWYGTAWDYNGYTNNPREGVIACGYFVSTTLKHAGCNLNRYHVAKSYSKMIAEVLTDNQTTTINEDGNKVIANVKSKAPGVYVVGLSNHVGFLNWDGETCYFVHGNYLGPVAVESELASQSDAFLSSETYVFGPLTSNETFVKKWLTQSYFEVPGRKE